MRITTFSITSLFALFASTLAMAAEVITLDENTQKSLALNGQEIARVAVSDPKIATINVLSKTTLLINGHQGGRTSLLVWPKGSKQPNEYQISVVPTMVSSSNVQVQTDIKVVEISKSALKEAGFFFG